MENSILNLFPIDPAYIIIALLVLVVVLLILVIVALAKIGTLNRKYDYFMQGKDAETLEDVILDLIDEIRSLKAEDRANKDSMRTLNRNSRASLQKVGIVEYNAFKGMGGNPVSYTHLFLLQWDSNPPAVRFRSERSPYSPDGCTLPPLQELPSIRPSWQLSSAFLRQ